MKSRLHRIEIRNFKAFRDFSFDLEGRHLLVYGPNGSGKSSLYWAIYTFLQSASKLAPNVSKYFDSAHSENLLNIYEQNEATPKNGGITLTLHDHKLNNDTSYCISQTTHGTFQKSTISKGNLASDFITYRFFFGFSNFRNSETFDLWPLFEKEILPFCVSTGGQNPWDLWHSIREENPNPHNYQGKAGAKAYTEFQRRTNTFASILPGIVDSISAESQRFYNQHFSSDDPAPVTLKLAVTILPSYRFGMRKFTRPVIEFGIKIGGDIVTRPQVFLNEAKLTQLALSVRFGASLVNLHDSDLKLLVLDDLLVSLDMSNRMKVLEILLSNAFANYQKIILTHEIGFFQEFRRHIGSDHCNWLFGKLTGDARQGPVLNLVKSDLEMAQDYLVNDQLTECGNRLRKYVEANLETFLNDAKRKKGLVGLFERDKFTTLAARINEAKSLLALSSYKEFAELLQRQYTMEELTTLLSADEIDPTKFNAATRKQKGKIIAKIISNKTDIQQCIFDLLTDASRKRLNAIKLLKDVENIKDRILNPASHAGVTPIYTKEAEDAVKVIQALEAALSAALATL